MAIGGSNKTLTITTRFDADASGYFKEVEKVKDKAKEAGDSWLGFSKSMGDAVKTGVNALGALNQAIEGVQKVIGFARDAIKGWGEDLRMEAANAGRSIDRLSEAAQGLVNDDALNKFAARAGSGALKLTQQQLETVAQAAVALRERGFETQEALDALTEAAVTGRTRGLKPLGLEVEEGNSKFETANNLIKELNKVITDSHGPVSKQADDIERLAVAWDNAVDSAKNYAAEAILAASASTGDLPERFLAHRKNVLDQIRGVNDGSYARTLSAFQAGVGRGRAITAETQLIEMPELNVALSDGERKKRAEAAVDRMARAILNSAIAAVDHNVRDVILSPETELRRRLGFEHPGAIGSTAVANAEGFAIDEQAILERVTAPHVARFEEEASRGSRYAASARGRNESYLATMFGEIEEFDAYATAFGTLQAATTSAMQAWISGSMSLGTAIKKGLGDALGGLASSLAVEALKHTAYAIGSLAFGDFGGAARHGAAAAAFGVGAAAAAAAAKKLGASAAADIAAANASSGATSSGGRAGATGGQQGGGSGQTIIRQYNIINGETFYQQSNRMRALDAERFVEAALGTSYVEHS